MMITVCKAIAAMLAACAVLAATGAAAADGEVLINQGKVDSGGITPGDTAGFPAELHRPGRYKLSGNLAVPANVNGIEVWADDVTIDLNGFSIRSSTPGAAASGVVATVNEGMLRVINGTITGFQGYGILRSAGHAVIEDMRLLSNGDNLSLSGGSTVRNSTIAGGNSVFIAPGIRCFARCLIEGNIITGNNGAGVSLQGGGGVVLGNVIVGNGNAGIQSATNRTGYGNNVLLSNGSGVQVSGLVGQLHPNVCNPACP